MILRHSYTAIIALLTKVTFAIIDNENGLIGEPEIQCNTDTVEMQFRTKRLFTGNGDIPGKVYVKGHYNNPNCRVDYSNAFMDNKPQGGIKLNHGECDMDRQRTLQPEGMLFSTVLVISFHPLFITKVDRAFHIKCMYREAVRTVKSEMEVSPLATTALEHTVPMPICTYTIRKDEIDGPILKYARVGDQVVHRWECQSGMVNLIIELSSDTYGVLVHSCYVEDGQGEKQLIIDAKGCHADRILLGDPTYTEALNMAYRESFVFKFADRVAVRFQCEIRLCLKDDGGCNGVTPPLCFDDNHRHISDKLAASATSRWTTAAMQMDDIPDILNWTTGETLAKHLSDDVPIPTTKSTDPSTIKTSSTLSSSSTLTTGHDNRPPRLRRSRRNHGDVNATLPDKKSSVPSIDTDLYSQYVYVFDNEDDQSNSHGNQDPSHLRSFGDKAPRGDVCLAPGTMTLIVAALVTVLGTLMAVVLFVWLKSARFGTRKNPRISAPCAYDGQYRY